MYIKLSLGRLYVSYWWRTHMVSLYPIITSCITMHFIGTTSITPPGGIINIMMMLFHIKGPLTLPEQGHMMLYPSHIVPGIRYTHLEYKAHCHYPWYFIDLFDPVSHSILIVWCPSIHIIHSRCKHELDNIWTPCGGLIPLFRSVTPNYMDFHGNKWGK